MEFNYFERLLDAFENITLSNNRFLSVINSIH